MNAISECLINQESVKKLKYKRGLFQKVGAEIIQYRVKSCKLNSFLTKKQKNYQTDQAFTKIYPIKCVNQHKRLKKRNSLTKYLVLTMLTWSNSVWIQWNFSYFILNDIHNPSLDSLSQQERPVTTGEVFNCRYFHFAS